MGSNEGVTTGGPVQLLEERPPRPRQNGRPQGKPQLVMSVRRGIVAVLNRGVVTRLVERWRLLHRRQYSAHRGHERSYVEK